MFVWTGFCSCGLGCVCVHLVVFVYIEFFSCGLGCVRAD